MSKQHSRQKNIDSNEKSQQDEASSMPLLSKIEEIHLRNLQNIITMLCQLINDFTKVIDSYDIQFTSQQLTPKSIISIKEANNEVKYHQKINPIQREQGLSNGITADIDYTLQLLAKLKIKQVQSNWPRVKLFEQSMQPSSFHGQLSTIAEKQSQQNLHNYLKQKSNKRRSKSNINKNYLFNTSSIQDIEFEVIREQTRKSLDNPYHKNNQTRKGLYNDLEKLKGTDNLLPAVKNYLDKHKKLNSSTKPPQYVIQKLI